MVDSGLNDPRDAMMCMYVFAPVNERQMDGWSEVQP